MEFIKHFKIFKELVYLLELICPDFFCANIFQQDLSLFWFIPKICLMGN